MPFAALNEVAKVYGYGDEKYGPYNYLAGYKYSLSIDSLFRHLLAWLDGEQSDIDESGYSHMAHVVWHGLHLLNMQLNPAAYKKFDDRQGMPVAFDTGMYHADGFHQVDDD